MTIDLARLTLTEKFAVFVTSLGFIGFIPLMPGTYGSLVGVIVYLFFPNQMVIITLTIISLIIGILLSSVVEKKYYEDPQFVIIDELSGMLIPLIFAQNQIHLIVISFILFRFFDIYKPLGIDKLQNLKGGFGVMFDDVLAGIYSLIIILIIQLL